MTTKYIPQIGDYFFAEFNKSRVKYYGHCLGFDEKDNPVATFERSGSIEDRPWIKDAITDKFRTEWYTFTKLPAPHNPDSLSDSQLEAKDGWRFLDEDEVGNVVATNALKEIEVWDPGWNSSRWTGNSSSLTYRTKLTRSELHALRNPNKQTTKQPNTSMTPLRKLPKFSLSSGPLAFLVASWLKNEGYEWDVNICVGTLQRNSTVCLSTNRPGQVCVYSREHQDIHFDSFEDFRKWYLTPEITIPPFATYPVSVTPTGVKVGCTEVTFAQFDEILLAISKKRESLEEEIPF